MHPHETEGPAESGRPAQATKFGRPEPCSRPHREPRALRRGSFPFPGALTAGPTRRKEARMSRADKATAIAELSEKFNAWLLK